MATYDERPFTVMMAFRRTARLMVDELVRRLEADGYRGVQPAYHAVFENIDPRRDPPQRSRGTRRHDPPVDERAGRHPRAPRLGGTPARPNRSPRPARLPHARRETDDSSGPAPHPRDRTRMAGTLAQSRLPRSLAPRARGRAQAARARRWSIDQRNGLSPRLVLADRRADWCAGHYHRNPTRRERADNETRAIAALAPTGGRVLLCERSGSEVAHTARALPGSAWQLGAPLVLTG